MPSSISSHNARVVVSANCKPYSDDSSSTHKNGCHGRKNKSQVIRSCRGLPEPQLQLTNAVSTRSSKAGNAGSTLAEINQSVNPISGRAPRVAQDPPKSLDVLFLSQVL